jgi:acyl-CoA synthetase (AMP-forming)/AMP-acid ligase II
MYDNQSTSTVDQQQSAFVHYGPDYSKPATLLDLLRQRAFLQPNKRAYTFLADGETEEAKLTYSELDRAARAIAATVQSYAKAGDRILLLYPSGLHFVTAFMGCQYGGFIAVPAPAPRPNKPMTRLEDILHDALPSVVLTTSTILAAVEKLSDQTPDLKAIRWIATDVLDLNVAERWQDPDVTSENLAFLQYTSGSTAVPRGVMVSHANILQNSAELDQGWVHGPDSAIISWLPHFHDMGLIYGVIHPLYKGVPAYLMPPVYFLQRPFRWLQAITRYQGTHSAAPNFAYELCVRKVTEEQKQKLDLSSWRVAVNGAEPVRRDTLESFAAAFASCGFRPSTFCPGYGLAEATLKVTSSNRDEPPVYQSVSARGLGMNRVMTASAGEPDARTLVSSGRTILNSRIAIVNPHTEVECAPDEVGEIWVAGPSIARGYWNRVAESQRTFGAAIKHGDPGPFLRTGDLGFVNEGELFVTGRFKDLIIIDGHNHYPHDIEETVEASHLALRVGCCAAFSVDLKDSEHLVIAAEIEPHYRAGLGQKSDQQASERRPQLNPGEVVKAVRRAVAEDHELQTLDVVLLKAGSLPKTSSGKIQRHACRQRYLNNSLELWS